MKTVKIIVADWLKANGFDGLCNPDAGCGCLIGDLAPCGEGCDWHVEIPTHTGVESHFADALNWRCSCGAVCDPFAASWRWSGIEWEHAHDYPLGHCAAFRVDSGAPSGHGLPSVNQDAQE